MNIRYRIFEIIEVSKEGDYVSKLYDTFMLIIIGVSIAPLMFAVENTVLRWIEYVTVSIFIIDYLMRWITADFKLGGNKFLSIIKYPFTFIAVIDVLSILPIFISVSSGFKALRMFRLFRIFRLFKVLRYSKSLQAFVRVFEREKSTLKVIFGVALTFVFMSALFIFQIENEAQPELFRTFFDAVWWAVATLTTVGYGDIYPITIFGKIVSMLLSIIGIAVIALPSGIITAGFIRELKEDDVEI